MTIRLTFALISLLTFLSRCNQADSYRAITELSIQERELVFPKIVRYIAKPPKMVKGGLRFDSRFDEYYKNAQQSFDWELFYIDPSTRIRYFLVSRDAPSLYKKRIGIGGSYQINQNEISNYREVFWTFKMKVPELNDKSAKLFKAMLKGEDLSPFYPQNSPENEEWIEFPDATTYYDADSLFWRKKG